MMSAEQIRTELIDLRDRGEHQIIGQAQPLGGNPRHFKYFWTITSLMRYSDELEVFRDHTFDAHQRIAELRRERRPFHITNTKLPRWGDHPLRPDSKRYGCKWATPYDHDPDLAVEGGYK